MQRPRFDISQAQHRWSFSTLMHIVMRRLRAAPDWLRGDAARIRLLRVRLRAASARLKLALLDPQVAREGSKTPASPDQPRSREELEPRRALRQVPLEPAQRRPLRTLAISTRLTHEHLRRSIHLVRTHDSPHSTDRGDRRLAPRGLGSGRRGAAPDAEARRDTRHRDENAERAGVPQRVRVQPLGRGASARGSPGRVRGQAERDTPTRPRLRRRRRLEEPLRARLPDPPRGALERRRTRHGVGLRLHRPRQTEVFARGRPAPHCTSAASSRSTRRRSGSLCESASPTGASSSSTSSCRGTRSPARTSRVRGRTGSTTPRRGSRSGAAPSSSGPGIVARRSRSSRNPRYWGAHRAYLDRIVYRFLPPEDVADALRSGEIDMIDPGPAALHAATAEFHQQPAPGITVTLHSRRELRAGRYPAGPRRKSRAREPACPAGTRLRNRPRRDCTDDRSALGRECGGA